MYVRVGLTNGDIKVSDSMTDERVQTELIDSGESIGSGIFSRVRVESIEDALAFMNRVMDLALADQKNGEVSIPIDGVEHTWPSSDVAWFRIVR